MGSFFMIHLQVVYHVFSYISFCFLFNVQVESGKVDGERLCITGCSAGGYTTLAALAFKETFNAGASLFGVSTLLLTCICFKLWVC